MILRYLLFAFAINAASLLMGVLGYHYTENLDWVDALLNASMILGGMGPVDTMHTVCGKLFASFYALYSCFLVLGLVSILMGPIMHQALKKYHLDPSNKR